MFQKCLTLCLLLVLFLSGVKAAKIREAKPPFNFDNDVEYAQDMLLSGPVNPDDPKLHTN